MSDGNITVVNKSDTRLLFSDFNAGDNAIPFDTVWLEPNTKGELKTGSFKSLSIGVQAQEGGRWIGGDPKEPTYAVPGQTFTFAMSRDFS